jgi:hypothetical protein
LVPFASEEMDRLVLGHRPCRRCQRAPVSRRMWTDLGERDGRVKDDAALATGVGLDSDLALDE